MYLKQRNLVTNILLWTILILTAYFAENVVLFDFSNFQRGFSLLEYALLFVGIIAIIGYFFYIEHKQNGLRAQWFFIALLIVVVIGAIIGIFLTPETQTYQVTEIVDEVETIVTKQFTLTLEEKINSALFAVIAGIGVYLQLFILPRLISFKKYVLFLMYVLVVVALITAILSYVIDYSSYEHLYQHGLTGYIYPQSFLFNRNMYALMLLLGMLALYNIISIKPKWYNYVFLIFLFINIFFTFSKAATGIALITFFIHFVYRMIATFKVHKIRNIIFLSLCGILVICGVLLIPFPFFMNVRLFNEARRFILEYYVQLGIGSYDTRNDIWDSVIKLADGVHLWFGRGQIIFNKTLTFYTGQVSEARRTEIFSHNGFLEILGQWGLIGLIPYCLGVLTILGVNIYVAIKDYKTGIPALIIFGAFLAYTMVETSTLFDLTIEGVTTTALVALPSLSWLYAKRHPEENHNLVRNAEELEYKIPVYNHPLFAKKTSMTLALFFGVATVGVFAYFTKIEATFSVYLSYVILILGSYMTLTRILTNLYSLRNKRAHKLFYVGLIGNIIAIITILTVYVLFVSPLVVVFAINVLVLNWLITERFFGRGNMSFKTFIRDSFIPSIPLFLAIAGSGSIVILLARGLSWFIIGEIIVLYIILCVPFVFKMDASNSSLNRNMLLAFGSAIVRNHY